MTTAICLQKNTTYKADVLHAMLRSNTVVRPCGHWVYVSGAINFQVRFEGPTVIASSGNNLLVVTCDEIRW